MAEKKVAPYGSWKSPISSDLIVSGSIGLSEIVLDGEDIYWTESRPAEEGRNVIVRREPGGRESDVTPPPFNARTRVHEYGGGAYTVADGVVYFSNFDDQRLYRQATGAQPEPLTPESELRYADAVVDRRRNRIVCVREDHRESGREAVNTVVSIDLKSGGEGEVVVAGSDFYSSPRLSPDGNHLAWLAWNHPNMPWDGTELWVAGVNEDGTLHDTRRVAGGVDESIFQPEWSPEGVLYFVSDRTGWWNLYRLEGAESIVPLTEKAVEFGAAQWVFGISIYAFESEQRIICAYNEKGVWQLASLSTETLKLEAIETSYTDIYSVNAATARAVFCASAPTEPTSIVMLDLATRKLEVLRRSSNLEIDAGYLSIPEAIEFPTRDGQTAHAFFYAPKNRDYAAPDGERPPLLVISHGGPTSTATTSMKLSIQYWSSHGIGVLDVNYGGSSGYGRAYRERLNGQWGIVDIDDCVDGARSLVERGLVDNERLIIRGGSAGGYTTLAALTFRDVFKSGASYYGVSDLEALTKDTHKFESRYLDSLIGPYPQERDLYRERSPIHFTERLSCPMIIFQGLEDKIVPPNQAEMMFDAVRAKGLPVAYVPFEGEQHGFRRAANIKRALDAEHYFYSKVFNFELAEPVEPVEIENL
ncbi:MAG: S9 family peptidase [Pyrinomonadaceae bacterium]